MNIDKAITIAETKLILDYFAKVPDYYKILIERKQDGIIIVVLDDIKMLSGIRLTYEIKFEDGKVFSRVIGTMIS